MSDVSALEQSQGSEGQNGAAQPGPVPEGFAHDHSRHAANSAQRARMSALRIEHGTPTSLDLLAAMDEPVSLIQALRDLAHEHGGGDWRVVFDHAQACMDELELNHQPSRP